MGPAIQHSAASILPGSDGSSSRISGITLEAIGHGDRSLKLHAWKKNTGQGFAGPYFRQNCQYNKSKLPIVIFASSYGRSSKPTDGAGGDPKVQQMLVDMVRIQVGKTRMIEFVDERSQQMRNIADEVVYDYDRIAYRTMKGFDDSGRRVLRQLDAGASAIEKDLMMARAEMEAHSRDFEEFQIRIAYSRNEGLFFKNLYKAPGGLRFQESLRKSQLEKKVAVASNTSGKDLSSSYRQLLYGGLSLVMVSFLWSSSSAFLAGTCIRASKLAAYGIIFSLLVAQLACANAIMGGQEDNSGGGDQ